MISLSAIVAASAVILGQAPTDSAMPEALRTQIQDRLIGVTVFDATYDNQKITGTECWRWGGNTSALIIEGRFVENGKENLFTSLGIWDAGKSSLSVTSYAQSGDSWTTCWTTFTDEEWQGRISGVFQGQQYDSPAKLTFLKDTLRYEDTTVGKPWVSIGRRPEAGSDAIGNKAFTSFMELAVGGKWTTSIDGTDVVHAYKAIKGTPFVRLSMKGSPYAGQAVCGMDPDTGKFTRWAFFEDGMVFQDVIDLETDGVWLFNGSGTGPKGRMTWKLRVKRVDANTVEEEGIEHTLNGISQPIENLRWTRSP